MKNIKFLISVLLVLYCSPSNSIAQTNSKEGKSLKKVQFIARAALNSSTVSVQDRNNEIFGTEKAKLGYNISVMADVSLGKNFYFQPNISLTAKGSKLREMDLGNYGNVDLTMNAVYLQLPLLFAYKIDLKRWNNSINIALGPYFAYGIGGSISGPIPNKIDTFGDSSLCNRPDVGINMEFSFEMPKFVFFMGYDAGFTKMIKSEYIEGNNLSFHNSNSYWGVGYKF